MKKLYSIVFLFVLLLSINPLSAKVSNVSYIDPGKDLDSLAVVLAPPSATIEANATSVCQNATSTTVTLTGNGGTAPYTFTYTINGVLQTAVTTGTNGSIIIPVTTTSAGTFNYVLESVTDSSAIPQIITGLGQTSRIIVNPQANANMSGTGSGSSFGGTAVFRQCNNFASIFTFTNTSLTSPSNTNYTISWGDGSPDFNGTTWSIMTHTYSVGLWNMVYTVKSSNGCDVVKNYIVFVGSNPAVSLGNPGNTDICNAESLTFPITGTDNNPPGTIYTVTFNDGSAPRIFNHPPPPNVTHTFVKSSCGTTSSDGSNSYPNSFSANIVATNPCSTSSVGVVPIYVSENPKADFSGTLTGCINKQICFTNTSLGNQVISNTCSSAMIVWSIFPSNGYTLIGGSSLGNDFSSADSSLWLSGSNNLCVNFTLPGTYTITIKTGNRCGFDIKTKTICIEPPLAPNFKLNTASGCIANGSGSALSVVATNTTPLIVSSCTPPTYVWSVTYASAYCGTSIAPIANQTTTDASYNFTEPGTYTIKLTATNSCGDFVTTKTVTVKKPPIISAINGILSNYCGTATINPTAIINSCTPLTGTLTYDWSFSGGLPASSTDENPTAISYAISGTHTVALIVKNECGYSVNFTKDFTISDVPTLTIAPLVQNICSGTASSAINLTSSLTGTTYSWTGTATSGITGFVPSGITNTIPSQTIVNTRATAGTVTYVITPTLNGCAGTAVNYVITINPGPSIVTQPTSSTLCIGGTPAILSIALNNSSGAPTYQWYSNTLNNTTTGTAISGETNPAYSPLASAIGKTYYYCIITLTSGGCSSLTSATASLTVVNSANIITQPLVSQNLCVGATINNPLAVSYSGGTGTPSYQWFINTTNSNTGGTSISGATNSTYTPPIFTLASSYFYYVTITFSGTSCGNITSSVAEIIIDNDPTITTQPLNSQTVCKNATATDLSVTMSGGSGTYSYQWYSNLTNNATGGTIIIGAISSIYSPLTTTVGTKYYYVITQNGFAGCAVTSATALVTTAAAPIFTAQPVSSTICLGQSTQPLSVAYTNGTGTAQYQWYINTSNSNVGGTSIASANGATFQPLTAVIGTNYYYCIVTFPSLVAGCGVITSNVAQIIVSPKASITSEIATICSGATFTIVPTNTSGNIVPTGTTYTWSNPTIIPSGSVTGVSAATAAQNVISQTLTNSTTSVATVVYTVMPTTGSCVGTAFTIMVTVNPATNPNAVKTDSTCFGVNNGSITTSSTGGITFSTGAPYLFSWSGPNSFTSTDPSISALAPGLYTLSINDAGGCPVVNVYTINGPAPITITTDTTANISCFGSANGAIAITAQGGVGNYSYTWTKDGNPYAGADDISNLSAGNYVVTVSDANSCTPVTASFSITEPPILVVSLVSKNNIECYGASSGSIDIDATGGTFAIDYKYLWSGPNGFASTNQNLTNLKSGTYNLTVTDDLGCNKNLSVNLTQSTEILINAVTTAIVCYGDDDATIAVTISGGNAPYQVQWANLAVGLNQNNLAPGDYTITVTDDSGCTKSKIINIPSPPIFTVNPLVTQISCFGANDGSIKLNLAGGKPTLKLVWSDGSLSGTTRNNLKAGTYTATIIDGTPCEIVRTFIIIEPQKLVLDANLTNALDCNDANSGAINLLVSGGTPPFTYSWSNGSITEDLNTIPAGNYLVTVKDARNCTASASYVILRPAPIVVKVETVTNFDCVTKVVNQSFIAKTTGGIPPYQFVWSSGTVSGPNNENMETSQNGLIVLNAIDSRGCSATYTFNVAIPELGTPSFNSNSIAYKTYGFYSIEDPIQFFNTATGDYTNVSWDFGDGTFSNEENPIHSYKKEASYVVRQTVTYPFGCVYNSNVTLIIDKGYKLIPPTAFTPNDDGFNDYYAPEFLGLNEIQFAVYDTWGALIYSELGDNIRGWDGKINNKEAENGNYYYKISGKTFYGKMIKDQGAFVLIK
ncbi:PKD domain-containing protein [Flavobacterium weaverense]|uniref:Gliding motility-associated-like protein n=1 Tax=Flavobacterium weaverense TaxID=271156 RepID=A0A3L9ZX92_9FLAO|nr:PKD domain-containing protein [Flavobacterium weaverense]RMA75025.1 gliding motility-associated-like protein [Flavobacterium weaverense]